MFPQEDGVLTNAEDTTRVLTEWLPAAVIFVLVVAGLAGARRLLEKEEFSPRAHRVRNALVMLGLTLLGAFGVFLSLPLDTDTRGQLLSFLGIVLSAALALSSTTFLGNAMAGVMLRAVRNFKVGDFIEVGDVFGRITELALFHMEVQTEDRDLVTLPLLNLVTQPVKIIRDSGTIVSATVSLGYDASRHDVERLLLRAAEGSGLSDPFVQILELGDFSITYRIAGLLVEVKQILSARSRLRAEMIDALHGGGVEIVSPTFMNQRVYAPETRFVSVRRATPPSEKGYTAMPESIVFDKAEEAESIENLRERRAQVDAEREALAKTHKQAEEEDKPALNTTMERLEVRSEWLGRLIRKREEKAEED